MTDANHLQDPTRPIQGRVPPNALDSEELILSAIFANPGDLDRCRACGLEGQHFSTAVTRHIYEAILTCDDTAMGIDLQTISYHLKSINRLDQVGGTPYLAQLITMPAIVNIEQHCRLILDTWRARQVISIQQESIAHLYAPAGVPVQALFEELETKIWEIAHQHRQSNYEAAGHLAERAVGTLAEALRSGTGLLGTTTGFEDLDEKTSGYQAGDLWIVAARPGLGKTAWVCSSLLQLTRPPPESSGELPNAAYLHSLEMPKEQLALRLACSLANVNFQLLRTGKIGRDGWVKLYQALVTLKRHPLYIDDKPAITVAEFRSNIRKIKREIELGRIQAKKLAAAASDYLQLMQGEKGQGREREISSISQGMKNTAKTEGVCVIALAQLNRQVEIRGASKGLDGKSKGKRPQLSDLRESGAIEQDADTILFLYREQYYDKDADNEAEFIIGKQRSGPTCTVYGEFDGATTTFRGKSHVADEFNDFGDDPRFTGGPDDEYDN